MTEKVVYDPKKHAANQKNAKVTKNPKLAKAKKKNEKDIVDAKAHAKDGADVEPEEPITEFKAKDNKWALYTCRR